MGQLLADRSISASVSQPPPPCNRLKKGKEATGDFSSRVQQQQQDLLVPFVPVTDMA